MSGLQQAYPLQWPLGYKRTINRISSRFEQTMDKAQRFLKDELSRLGATKVTVSTNIPVRRDGMLYADCMNKKIDDPGVAVYFHYKGKETVLCCDQYNRIWENIYAIGKTVENLRAINRYGVSDFLNRSFSGFQALPEAIETPYKRAWWEVLEVNPNASAEEIKEAYRNKVKKVHPDMGGSTSAFLELQKAYKEALTDPDL
jgi:hypothetical protein